MDQESRLQLLDGTTITLVLHYSGTATQHAQQIAAAQNNISPYIYEKLCEQAGNAGRGFSSIRVEVPEKALASASQDFAGLVPDKIYMRDAEPDTFYHKVDLGPILPGYAMHVLNWYCRALQSRLWEDFTPANPSVQECDKFHWLFSYVTMRKIGLHGFADSLCDRILRILVEQCQLADEFWMLDFILENLAEGDSLFRSVSERYIVLEILGQSPLLLEQWVVITHTYPHFGNLVSDRQAALRELSKAMEEMAHLGIQEDDGEQMDY